MEEGGGGDSAAEEGVHSAGCNSTVTTLETGTATECKMPTGKSAASHNGSGVATTTGDGYGLPAPTAARNNGAAGGRTMAGQNGSVPAFVMAFIALIRFFEFRHHMYEYCFLVV